MSVALTVPGQIAVIATEELWDDAGWLPCTLTVEMPLHEFTVRNLLQLEVGTIVETKTSDGADVPVLVNSRVIGWGEFELIEQRIAVRMTGVG